MTLILLPSGSMRAYETTLRPALVVKVCCRQTQPGSRQVIDFAGFTLKGTESLSVNRYGERTALESALGPLAHSLGQHILDKTLAALGFFKPLP